MDIYIKEPLIRAAKQLFEALEKNRKKPEVYNRLRQLSKTTSELFLCQIPPLECAEIANSIERKIQEIV